MLLVCVAIFFRKDEIQTVPGTARGQTWSTLAITRDAAFFLNPPATFDIVDKVHNDQLSATIMHFAHRTVC